MTMPRPGQLRVAVVTGRIGELDPVQAGSAIGRGLTRSGATVAVVPIAAGGPDLGVAVARLWEADISGMPPAGGAAGWWVRSKGRLLAGWQQAAVPDWAPEASTEDFGTWLASELRPEDEELVLDLTGITAHDGGRGLWTTAGDQLAARNVLGLVTDDELTRPATGIGGALALRAFAASLDVAELLAADAAMVDWAETLRPGFSTEPGGGAAGGAGLAVLASDGRLISATQFCHSVAGLGRTLAVADLVVTGCTELSALDRGGPVVTAVAEWALGAELPCELLTPGPLLSVRELRTLGIEVAHQVSPEADLADQLGRAADRIATTWLSGAGGPDVD